VTAMLATFAKLERERIRQCTLAGIEAARREGRKIGRPYVIFDRDRVLQMHKVGRALDSRNCRQAKRFHDCASNLESSLAVPTYSTVADFDSTVRFLARSGERKQVGTRFTDSEVRKRA